MKAEIWKFPLRPRGITTVVMPEGAKVLSVQNQREVVTLWAQVDPQHPISEDRNFMSLMTGEGFSGDPKLAFLGTVQLSKGQYVAHIFEVPRS